jgi:hypothetical protein
MAGVVFYFEHNDIDVYSGRAIDLDAWYLASQISPDIDKMLVVNRTDTRIAMPQTNISLEVVRELPELEGAVYLDPTKGESLWGLEHSSVNWYVFGPAGGWGREDPNKRYINIPHSPGVHCHSQHVMTTVMFHRYGSMM